MVGADVGVGSRVGVSAKIESTVGVAVSVNAGEVPPLWGKLQAGRVKISAMSTEAIRKIFFCIPRLHH
jgi:hypothetical protein